MIMCVALLTVMIALAILVTPVTGQTDKDPSSGNFLADLCDSEEGTFGNGFCIGGILGFESGFKAGNSMHQGEKYF